MKKAWRTAAGIVIVAMLCLLAWAYVLYQDKLAPKNMRYVMWKHSLAAIDLDRAVGTIEEDPDGKRDLILGQTQAQLRARFGFLLDPHEAGAVLERCIQGSWAEGKDAMFLRNSNMIVVFENGRAVHTGLLKPC